MKKIVTLSALFIVLLVGCSQNNGVAVNEVDHEVIKIGAISPLTGSAASYGEPASKAVVLAVEQINKDGGILGKEVKLIMEDGVCDSTITASAVNKLAFIDRVKVILGGHCSTESLTIAQTANKNKIIQLASITASSKYSDAGDYSFRNWPSSSYYQSLIGNIAFNKGARKMAIINEQKDYPVSSTEAFRDRFKELGGEIILDQSFLSGEVDFRTYLLKIKSKKEIDGIFFANQSEVGASLFFKTMKELDMIDKYLMFSNDDPITKKVFDETGGLNSNVFTANVYVSSEEPKMKKLLEDYKIKYGDYPQTSNYYVACSYDAMYIIKDAIEYCGDVDTDCIKSFLYSLKDWKGAAGTITFDENGDIETIIKLHYFDNDGNEIYEDVKP